MTPASGCTGLRRIGQSRLAARLQNRKVRNAQPIAATAVAAEQAQHSQVPGEQTAAAMVHTLAKAVIALDEEIARTDALIEARFCEHRHAVTITPSMPGIGTLLGAEFIAAPEATWRPSAAPDDSPARRPGSGSQGLRTRQRNMRRPYRYHRRLLRVFYLSAQIAARFCPVSQAFYDHKRSEGKSHKQAILALAQRRLAMVWALIRDRRTFAAEPPRPA
jgi:hypothetical protein